MPTITKPAVFRLKSRIRAHQPPVRCDCWAMRPSTSMVPTKKATSTDRPVTVRL